MVVVKRKTNNQNTPTKNSPTKKQRLSESSNNNESVQKIEKDDTYTSVKFEDVKGLSKATVEKVTQIGANYLTKLQKEVIPLIIDHKNVIASAPAGSGKMLSVLVPIVEQLNSQKTTPVDGTIAIIVTLSREFAVEVENVVKAFASDSTFNHRTVTGGSNIKTEQEAIAEGVNVVVGTPGRLLVHMKDSLLSCKKLKYLVVYGAEKMDNFVEQMGQVSKYVPATCQKIVIGSRNNANLMSIAEAVMKVKEAKTVEIKQRINTDGLKLEYAVCERRRQLAFLHNLLVTRKTEKIVVLFNSSGEFMYYEKILNDMGVKVDCTHGGKVNRNKQQDQVAQFNDMSSGAFFCTAMAAHFLNLTDVDIVVHFDLCDENEEYLNRVCESAKWLKANTGYSLMLMATDNNQLMTFIKKNTSAKQADFDFNKMKNITKEVEKFVKNEKNKKLAERAYRTILRIHQVNGKLDSVDRGVLAKAFGFSDPPSYETDVPRNRFSN